MSIKWVKMGEDTWALLVPGGALVSVYGHHGALAVTFVPGHAEEIASWIHHNREKPDDA